jgi:hypothetical protein
MPPRSGLIALVRRAPRAAGALVCAIHALVGSSCTDRTPTPPKGGPRDDAPVTTVVVATPERPIYPGDTAQLRASTLDRSGAPVGGVEVSWQSSDTTVASVSATGLLTARGPGAATVSATAARVTGQRALAVRRVPLAGLWRADSDTALDFPPPPLVLALAETPDGRVWGYGGLLTQGGLDTDTELVGARSTTGRDSATLQLRQSPYSPCRHPASTLVVQPRDRQTLVARVLAGGCDVRAGQQLTLRRQVDTLTTASRPRVRAGEYHSSTSWPVTIAFVRQLGALVTVHVVPPYFLHSTRPGEHEIVVTTIGADGAVAFRTSYSVTRSTGGNSASRARCKAAAAILWSAPGPGIDATRH